MEEEKKGRLWRRDEVKWKVGGVEEGGSRSEGSD